MCASHQHTFALIGHDGHLSYHLVILEGGLHDW
jgi:hypothetical protein